MKKKTNKDIEEKNRELAIQAAVAIHEQRGEDIVILDLRRLVDYADFFVIASASSLSRIRGIARNVERVLAKSGGKRLNQPDRETVWVLADFGDVLVHLFEREAREFYRLEDLWGDAPTVEWRDRVKDAPPPGPVDYSDYDDEDPDDDFDDEDYTDDQEIDQDLDADDDGDRMPDMDPDDDPDMSESGEANRS
ncbi:MAG: ribosome silencing factor [Planctomycetaceae bacterium]|nr:ribosome silencing factor [Planctomycetaceae bacterium]